MMENIALALAVVLGIIVVLYTRNESQSNTRHKHG
jgi:hypothetical protein